MLTIAGGILLAILAIFIIGAIISGIGELLDRI